MKQVYRRDILVLAVAWAAFQLRMFVPVSAAAPRTGENEAIRFRWRVPTAQYETVEDSLVFDGEIEEERDTKGLPLVFVFVGVALLPSLVDAILTLRRKLVQPGITIDARGPVIKIDVDPTLPRGMILLCDKTGCKLYEPNQLTDPVEFAKLLSEAKSK